MLSFVAVLSISSAEFGIMVTGECFCSSSIVGLNCSNKFRSSIEGSVVAVILLAGDLNAAIKTGTGIEQGLTHKVLIIDNET